MFTCIRLADSKPFMCVCVCVCVCVYYESHPMDRCLQWGWVICLHYTTMSQSPRAIISSDLPKHKHPETGSPTCYRQDPSHKAKAWAHNGPSRGLGALEAIQHPNTEDPQKAPFPSPTVFLWSVLMSTHVHMLMFIITLTHLVGTNIDNCLCG